jgi:hypothetical protein
VVILRIKIKRGLKIAMPILEEGELAYTIDDKTVYIGTSLGNKLISRNSGMAEGKSQIIYPDIDDGSIYWIYDAETSIYSYNWNHNLNTTDLYIQCYEILESGILKQVYMDDIMIINNNTITLETYVNLSIKCVLIPVMNFTAGI